MVFIRSAIEGAREINHHGVAVEVDDGVTLKENSEPWRYDKDLVSRNEKVQDAALRKVFLNYKVQM